MSQYVEERMMFEKKGGKSQEEAKAIQNKTKDAR
jgi:hypothetical protein